MYTELKYDFVSMKQYTFVLFAIHREYSIKSD